MAEPTCGRCFLPIHPSEIVEHHGFHVCHEPDRCVYLVKAQRDAAVQLFVLAECAMHILQGGPPWRPAPGDDPAALFPLIEAERERLETERRMGGGRA